ncbi:MAG: hypothetical protein RB191_08825 [Terriglobia bacterium]|nr:hypothetical protein [Terriglobia bacterium]
MNSPSPNRMLFHRQTYPHGSQPVDLNQPLPCRSQWGWKLLALALWLGIVWLACKAF